MGNLFRRGNGMSQEPSVPNTHPNPQSFPASPPSLETACQQSQHSKLSLFYYHLHPAQDLAFITEFMKANFPKAQELKAFPFPYEQLKPKPYQPCQLVIFIDINARMDTSMWEQMEEDLLKFAKPCIFVRVHNVISTSHSFDQPPPHFMEKFCWCKTSYNIQLDPTGLGENRPMLLHSRKLADDINALLEQQREKID